MPIPELSPSPASQSARSLARWLPILFLLLIIAGSVSLRSRWALNPGAVVSRLDAFFLATSAVTGTGLSVVEPAQVLSRWGWLTVTFLSEAGLLGVLVLGALVVEGIEDRTDPSRCDAAGRRHSPWTVAAWVTILTLTLEAVGALLLLPLWKGEALPRWALSGLHSVAAVGHTGFSPLPSSLRAYRYSILTHAVVFPLMVLGGFGYPVLRELWRAVRTRNSRCLSPFIRMILAGTAAAYLFGVVTLTASWLAPSFYERLQLGTTSNMHVPAPLSVGRVGGAVIDAGFLSMSARGAGLITVPMDQVTPAGRFALVLMIFAGGSPGGAGGGMFVVVLAVMVMRAWAAVRGGGGDKESPFPLRWAVAIAVFFLGLVAAGIFLMSLFEPYPFITIAFEAVSAASAAGLTLGITGILTAFSKCVVIALMFFGRLGPLWLLARMASRE